MKITIFVNFVEGLLKTPIAITLDDSQTLTELNQIRIEEHKTPYDSVYNSRAAMPLQYQHKDRVFTPSDLNKSLRDLGLQDKDSININISEVTLAIMRDALTADLLATNVDDPRSHSTPLSLALIAQRQLSNKPWTENDLSYLRYNISFEKNTAIYNQLIPLFSMLPAGTELEEDRFVQLAEALRNNKTILGFILSVNSAFINKQAATALADALRWNTTLEMFELSSADIENGAIAILITGLKENKTLLTLKMSDLNINTKDVAALADLLKMNTTLRSIDLNLDISDADEKLLIAAAKNSTSLENFILKDEIFKNRESLQLTHRREYTTRCMLSILNSDFKNLTDVTRRSGYLDFEFVNLVSLAKIIIKLQLVADVLVLLITEYLKDDMILTPLPSNFLMTKEILAKKPSLAELTKDIVLSIKEVKNSVVIAFTENTPIPRKLLLRNALMDLFREKQLNNAIADVSSSTGLLTIHNVALEKLEGLNILPRNHNSRRITT